MRIGMTMVSADAAFDGSAAVLERVVEAESLGLSSAWFPSGRAADPVPLIVAAAQAVREIGLGTFVVPVGSRHPAALAGEMRTAAALAGRTLTVGVGAGHQEYLPYESFTGGSPMIEYLREYLYVLRAGVNGEPMTFTGRAIRCDVRLRIEAPACQVLLAAQGPRMAELAGEAADGVALWLCGPDRAARLVDRFRARHDTGGRVVVGVPLVVSDHVDAARAQSQRLLARYRRLANYARVLDAEADVHSLSVIGDQAAVLDALRKWAAIGVTDLVAVFVPVENDPDCFERTRAVLAGAVREFDNGEMAGERTAS